MEYNFDLQAFREGRGISRMKFCEISGLNPSTLVHLEQVFHRGWTRGNPDTIEKVKDAVKFVEDHDIRIFKGYDSFNVTWTSTDGKKRAHLFPFSTALSRRIFE